MSVNVNHYLHAQSFIHSPVFGSERCVWAHHVASHCYICQTVCMLVRENALVKWNLGSLSWGVKVTWTETQQAAWFFYLQTQTKGKCPRAPPLNRTGASSWKDTLMIYTWLIYCIHIHPWNWNIQYIPLLPSQSPKLEEGIIHSTTTTPSCGEGGAHDQLKSKFIGCIHSYARDNIMKDKSRARYYNVQSALSKFSYWQLCSVFSI